jgi:hypothetical protein
MESGRPFRRLSPDSLRPVEVETAIADFPFERAYLFDADGRQIARFDGDESRMLIRLTPSEERRLRGGMMIHNHPPNIDLPRDDPRFDSASFSDLDVTWAAYADISLMIAVSPRWRHVLERPAEGWHATLPSEAEFEDSISLLYYAIDEDDRRRIDRGETTRELVAATRSHRTNLRFCREIGAAYRRERR